MTDAIVIGNGHLGRYIAAKLSLPIAARRLEEFDPDGFEIVINTAGKTDLAWCEENKPEAIRNNVAYPALLHDRCVRSCTRLIHLSSGCVWQGPYRPDGQAFGPEDPPDPACFYAETKATCDTILMDEADRVGTLDRIAILRLRMPYSPIRSTRNLIDKLCRYERLIDEPNSVTSADTLVSTIALLIDSPESVLWGRISCIYDHGVTTPYKIGQMLAQAGLRDVPDRFTKADLDSFHRPQRVSVVMHDPIFEAAISPPFVDEELRRVIELYAKA